MRNFLIASSLACSLFTLISCRADAAGPNKIEPEVEPEALHESMELTQQARTLMQDGEAENAIKILHRAATLNPQSSEPHVKLADAYFLIENFQAGLAECRKALSMHLNDTRRQEVLYRQGCIYGRMKKTDDALESFNQVLQINPQYVRAYRGKAEIYRLNKKYREATNDYEKYIAMATAKSSVARLDLPLANLNCADCYRMLGERQKERLHLSKLLELSPHSAEGFRLRGESYYADAKYKEAADDFANLLKLDPGNSRCKTLYESALKKAN